jgi:hypothetical protein
MPKQVPAQKGFAETDFPSQHGESTAGNTETEVI